MDGIDISFTSTTNASTKGNSQENAIVHYYDIKDENLMLGLQCNLIFSVVVGVDVNCMLRIDRVPRSTASQFHKKIS